MVVSSSNAPPNWDQKLQSTLVILNEFQKGFRDNAILLGGHQSLREPLFAIRIQPFFDTIMNKYI